ncbi:MAG: 50S ribosomal protein L29 [Proteobacteria bacterium]|nr:50S ribosomal protein L29 [Pseudomonadota bacterium]MBU1686024.1 50S ribosomal protein L29 [Pseudomonadota bacterium]
MKVKDIRELSAADLAVKAKDLSEELFNLRFQHGIRPLENPAKIRLLRKDISRVKTILTEKSRA